MTDVRRGLPVDDRKTGAEAGGGDSEEATATASALRDRILADPAGKAAYERASEEIGRHQVSLAKVRKLRALAQATVAEAMGMDQSEISRLERRTDLLLSTLRRFVNATGGELHLVASYPDGDVELLVGATAPEDSGAQPLLDASGQQAGREHHRCTHPQDRQRQRVTAVQLGSRAR